MKTVPRQNELSLGMGVPDRPITGIGQCRAFSGDVMEEIITRLFCLEPGFISGARAVNPDAFTHEGKPVEIKSLKKSQKLVIYDWRAEKDPCDQLYFIGIHNREKADTVAGIWAETHRTLSRVLIMPSTVIHALASIEKLATIKMEETKSGDRNGYQRKGYNRGYRSVPFKSMMELCQPLPFRVSAEVHGLRFEVTPWIFTGDEAQVCAEIVSRKEGA